MAGIHDRMPVILNTGHKYETWLTADNAAALKGLLSPYAGEMIVYPVSNKVNSVKNDNAGLIERLT